MLPQVDGLEVCRRLRSRSSVPIIMLTAKSEEIDKVVGLELGADDYITKPFSLREFSSRIKAALRRAEMSRPAETAPDEAPLEIRELRIDFPKRTVRVRGEDAAADLRRVRDPGRAGSRPGRVFTRDMLLARIWGDSAYRDPRTIDVHIRHLREKVERDPKDPEYLFTVRGVGYRFRDTEPSSSGCRDVLRLSLAQPAGAGVLRDHAAGDRRPVPVRGARAAVAADGRQAAPSWPSRRRTHSGAIRRTVGSSTSLPRVRELWSCAPAARPATG